jgi:hypothetical protein
VRSTDTPDTVPQASVAGRRSTAVRRTETVLLATVLLGLAAWFGVPWYRDRSYVGTTTAATIEWTCFNHVYWTDDERRVRWDAVQEDDREDRLDTLTALDGTTARGYYSQLHRVTGTMRFDGYADATFIGPTGSELRFTRHREGQLYSLACAVM